MGSFAAVVYLAALFFWPRPVAGLLALAAAAWVTGGLHEDGWADSFDGFAASRDREQILAVMKDSRIGSSGALALVLLILAKVAVLAILPSANAPAAMIAAHTLSRWSSLPLMRWLPYARTEGGMARSLVGEITAGRFGYGTTMTVLILIAALRWSALPAGIVVLTAVVVAGLFFHRRLRGVTGDCLGAANQLVELAVLLVVAAQSHPAP